MYASAITDATIQSRILHCDRGLTHHRHLCPGSRGLSALCSKIRAESTHEKRERFLELRDLLFGEGVCLYNIDGQRSAYLCASPGKTPQTRGLEKGKGSAALPCCLEELAARGDCQMRGSRYYFSSTGDGIIKEYWCREGSRCSWDFVLLGSPCEGSQRR